MNIQEWGEPMVSCPFHPLEDIVGICASCLRERLHHLKAKIELQRAFSRQNFPTLLQSDYSSAQSPENPDVHNSIIGPHHSNCAVKNRQIVAETRSMWLTKPAGQNKERRIRFIALRSFFDRLDVFRRSQGINRDPCLSHEDSFITIKFESNNEEYEGANASLSESSAPDGGRSRIKEMFRLKWRMRKSANVKKKESRQIGGLKDSSYQFPTSRIWSLSTLNCNEGERHSTDIQPKTKQNRSWVRTLTAVKWGLH